MLKCIKEICTSHISPSTIDACSLRGQKWLDFQWFCKNLTFVPELKGQKTGGINSLFTLVSNYGFNGQEHTPTSKNLVPQMRTAQPKLGLIANLSTIDHDYIINQAGGCSVSDTKRFKKKIKFKNLWGCQQIMSEQWSLETTP